MQCIFNTICRNGKEKRDFNKMLLFIPFLNAFTWNFYVQLKQKNSWISHVCRCVRIPFLRKTHVIHILPCYFCAKLCISRSIKVGWSPITMKLVTLTANSCWMLQNTKFTLALLGLRTHDIRYAICATSSIASLSIHRALRYQIIQADFSHNNSINNSLGDA